MRPCHDSFTEFTLTLLATKRLYEKECDITPLKGPSTVQAATLVPLILASFFFVVRLIAKSSGLAGGWGLDDYTIIVSYVSGTAWCSFVRYWQPRRSWESPYTFLIFTVSQGSRCSISKRTSTKKKSVIRSGFGQNIWDVPFPTITRFYQVRVLSPSLGSSLTRSVFPRSCCDV